MKILIFSCYDSGYAFSIKSIDTMNNNIKLIADTDNYTKEQNEIIYEDMSYLKKLFPNYDLYICCEDGYTEISMEKARS